MQYIIQQLKRISKGKAGPPLLKKFMKRFFILPAILCSAATAHSQRHTQKIIAYYSGNAAQLDSFDLTGVTHIIHSFSHLKGTVLNPGNPGLYQPGGFRYFIPDSTMDSIHQDTDK